jgi:uncharacterized protein YwbE
MSETIAAALYLISQNSKPGAVLVKLTPGEIERVIDIVQRGLTFFRRGLSPPSRTADPRRRRSSRPPHGLKIGLALPFSAQFLEPSRNFWAAYSARFCVY